MNENGLYPIVRRVQSSPSLKEQNKQFRALMDQACFALQSLQEMPELREQLWRALQQPVPEK